MPEHDVDLIADAVRMAGRVALSYFGRASESWEKPDGAGPVTDADLAVNTYLESALKLARPDYGWLSEETEDTAERLSCETVFIVDPIDGTRSFVEGSNTWAHSVAVAHKGVVTAGAIFLPRRNLLYTAARDKGAWLNGDPLQTSTQHDLSSADVLATRPVMSAENWPNGTPDFARSHRPSLAYRLGLVGQGRFDAMLTFRPTWEWDVAAGALIVEEASGTCSDKTGGQLRFNNPQPQLNGMIACGQNLHKPLLQALGR